MRKAIAFFALLLSLISTSPIIAQEMCNPPIAPGDTRHDNFTAVSGYYQPAPSGFATGQKITIENTASVTGFGGIIASSTNSEQYIHFALYNDVNGSPQNRLWESDVVKLPKCTSAPCTQEWSVHSVSAVLAGDYWLFVETTSSIPIPWAVANTTNNPLKLFRHAFSPLPGTMAGLSLINLSLWPPSYYVIIRKFP